MQFQVLSHAGLLVKNKMGKTLICDPWLIGSSYWRSWWNFPPVSRKLVDTLKPDYIYLTHIHWDHFHGPSLNLFSKDTPIIIPKGNYTRMRDDLNYLGFHNIIELKHAQTKLLDDGFKITSYQIWMFLDSALLIECEGVTLLNLNDSKHMGPTLKQIIRKHPAIDFVFRSHSSANERMSYTVVDDPDAAIDDLESYTREFAQTVRATGARYAIPFASNHCHLHKDSFHFNEKIQHPELVRKYFEKNGITSPKVQVMVSGDSWSSDDGFTLTDKRWFDDREIYLGEYLRENQDSLNKFYAEEDSTVIEKNKVDEYFARLAAAIPYALKLYLRKQQFTYVLSAEGKTKYIFQIHISSGKVQQLDPETRLNPEDYPIQIHTTAFIFLRGIEYRIFSHMCIGKRVFYKVTRRSKKYMETLNMIFNFYDYDMFPLKHNFRLRSLESWIQRWREIALYSFFTRDILLYKKINTAKYLKPINRTDP